jgi:Zn-dependent peptidase ImmA (M78 family)/predicted secreted protein
MTTRRDAILQGAKHAARIHRDLGTMKSIQNAGGRVDVFGAILSNDISLLFRPLDKLLGLFIRKPLPGVLITTNRELSVQRFTGAHELGHFALGHLESYDDKAILARSPISGPAYNLDEVAADAFATGFLMPDWLFKIHAARQGWNKQSMSDPLSVYQMSLRVGASYIATCYVLEQYKIISSVARAKLLEYQPKEIKQHFLSGLSLNDWHGDVWALTDRDQGSVIEGGPNDAFVLRLKEKSTAGYLWNIDQLKDAGFAIVRDEREQPENPAVGGWVDRTLTAQPHDAESGSVSLSHERPWQPKSPIGELSFEYELYGKEKGLPRIERRKLAAA